MDETFKAFVHCFYTGMLYGVAAGILIGFIGGFIMGAVGRSRVK